MKKPDNPHGYKLENGRLLICPHCGKLTNSAYILVSNLPCWSCGKPLKIETLNQGGEG